MVDCLRFLTVLFVAWVTLWTSTNYAQAAEVTFQDDKSDPTIRRIYLEGEIVTGDLRKIEDAAKGKYINRIVLWSPGGDLQEALRLSSFMNNMLIIADAPFQFTSDGIKNCASGYRPRYQENCVCNSACAVIWLTAPGRTGNIVGVHRPRFNYDEFAGLSSKQAKKTYENLLSGLRLELVAGGVPPDIVERMSATSSSDIYMLSQDDVDRIGKMKPFLDELLNSRCKKYLYEREKQRELSERARVAKKQAEICSGGSLQEVPECRPLIAKSKQASNQYYSFFATKWTGCKIKEWHKLATEAQKTRP